VKVLDFGLVKEVGHQDPTVTSPDTIAGTPLFMAPEAITSPDTVDARADIYALGAVAYYLLTAEPPFQGANVVDVYHGHLYVAPTAPSLRLGRPVAPELEAIVMQCLAKAAADRPASASVLADQLEALGTVQPWSQSDARAWWHTRPVPVTHEPRAVIGDPGLTSGLGPTVAPPVKITVRQRPL